MDRDIIPVPALTADGQEHLTESEARAYLEQGYDAEADSLMAVAARFPGAYQYTADRHRYVVFSMPGAYWLAGDCAESEESIKSLGREAGRRFAQLQELAADPDWLGI